jgi:RimJ/RimL family protein N-acetyltransferase
VVKRLNNGKPVLIRPIRADDKRLLQDMLDNLSPESVQRRYLSPKKKFTRAELRYLTEVDGWDHMALVAESPVAPSRRILGVGRYVRDAEHHDSAEVAFEVVDDHQRMGLGSLLADELAHRGAMRGVTRFTASMAADNVAAHKLFAKLLGCVARHCMQRQHVGYGVDEVAGEIVAA